MQKFRSEIRELTMRTYRPIGVGKIATKSLEHVVTFEKTFRKKGARVLRDL